MHLLPLWWKSIFSMNCQCRVHHITLEHSLSMTVNGSIKRLCKLLRYNLRMQYNLGCGLSEWVLVHGVTQYLPACVYPPPPPPRYSPITGCGVWSIATCQHAHPPTPSLHSPTDLQLDWSIQLIPDSSELEMDLDAWPRSRVQPRSCWVATLELSNQIIFHAPYLNQQRKIEIGGGGHSKY